MKNKRLLESFGLLDDKYIEEAEPKAIGKRIKLSVIAACAAIAVMSVVLWLFIPFRTTAPDVSRYSGSEYYELISTLNEMTFSPPIYKNNFERFVLGVLRAEQKDIANAPGSAMPDSESEGNYIETTDNQVDGITEADLIKRSDKYIYYLGKNELRVYSIDGEDSQKIGSYTLPDTYNMRVQEFYLSKDCRTVTVFRTVKHDGSYVTEIVSLDVSSPESIILKNNIRLSGEYLSSRLVDGKLLVLTNYFAKTKPNYGDESDFVPMIENNGEESYVSPDRIFIPEDAESSYGGVNFVVVCMLDAATLEEKDMYSFFTYYSDAYVSNDSVYLARNYREKTPLGGNVYSRRVMSEIARLSYSDRLEYIGSAHISGEILDRYSLDEKDGVLRAVTTVDERKTNETYEKDRLSAMYTIESTRSASLFCIDRETMQTVASVERFAPEGESVRSVRFKGDEAYVCTAIFVSDPVFYFDLSDINNITYKQTEEIEGFSTSLIDLGDGYLAGIGTSDGNSLKIEVYREGESSVIPVCKYEVPNAEYSTEYRSYFIDREKGLIGLGVSFYNIDSEYISVYKDNYVLLHFNGETFTELVNTSLPGYNSHKRATLIDGVFYMFSPETFKVQRIE